LIENEQVHQVRKPTLNDKCGNLGINTQKEKSVSATYFLTFTHQLSRGLWRDTHSSPPQARSGMLPSMQAAIRS
jgi:hypothetical protein